MRIFQGFYTAPAQTRFGRRPLGMAKVIPRWSSSGAIG